MAAVIPDRAPRALFTLAVTFALLLVAPPMAAQVDPSPVRLVLTAQTTTLTPGGQFRIGVRATNLDITPLDRLTLSLWVYPPARSRTAYHQSLEQEPPTAPLLVARQEVPGTLGSGDAQTLTIRRELRALTGLAENALHPVKVQLESNFVPVGVLRTALVFIQERPLTPLNVSLTFVLDPPPAIRADDTIESASLQASMAPGGRIDVLLRALKDYPIASTLVISPLFLRTLVDMADGYRAAALGEARPVGPRDAEAQRAETTLFRLRELARDLVVQVVALPYAGPSVPALLDAGLGEDLERHVTRGRAAVEEILGVPPAEAPFRPPGSFLTEESLPAIEALGASILLPDAELLPAPDGLAFSAPPTVLAGGKMTAVVPDEGVGAYLVPTDDGSDARLRAAQAIGELAEIYFEHPSELRGVALLFTEETAAPAELLRPILAALAAPPPEAAWMRPSDVTHLVALPDPEEPRRLRERESGHFSSRYASEILASRAAIGQFESMAGTAPLTEDLRELLLIAESRIFVDRERDGLEFIRAVRRRLGREFGKVEVPSRTPITLTSSGGVIPVTLRSAADYPVRIRVTLASPRLAFLEGASREITLDGQSRSIVFPVRAQTTGRFPVRVVVATPGGRLIEETSIVVRSTAYNRLALFVTIGAAIFLAAWWGRRFLRPAKP